MYYCLHCKKTHDCSASSFIFNSGFTNQDGKIISVGFCIGSESSKTIFDDLESKLAYLQRHAS